MKRWLFILLVAISAQGFAQKDTLIDLPMQDGKIFYEHVYQAVLLRRVIFLQRAKDSLLAEYAIHGLISIIMYLIFSTK
jgi:hypothetical protein